MAARKQKKNIFEEVIVKSQGPIAIESIRIEDSHTCGLLVAAAFKWRHRSWQVAIQCIFLFYDAAPVAAVTTVLIVHTALYRLRCRKMHYSSYTLGNA